MNGSLLSLLALIVTLGVLISFHEFGHFWVARRLGVKVLRFSIGFGKPLWSRRGKTDDTEYVIAAIPLGGYVQMLDEREGNVPAQELSRAFNRKPVGSRIAIVAAGPAFNFIFAILAFSVIYMLGVNSIKPLLDAPRPDSIAEAAGFQPDDLIVSVDNEPVQTLEAALLRLIDRSLAGGQVEVEVLDRDQRRQLRTLDLAGQDYPVLVPDPRDIGANLESTGAKLEWGDGGLLKFKGNDTTGTNNVMNLGVGVDFPHTYTKDSVPGFATTAPQTRFGLVGGIDYATLLGRPVTQRHVGVRKGT